MGRRPQDLRPERPSSRADVVACVDAVTATRHGAAVPGPLAEIRQPISGLVSPIDLAYPQW